MKQRTLTVLVTLTISAMAAIGSAQNMKVSLYERLGGIHIIAQGASNCVDMESSDMVLLNNSHVKMAFEGAPAPLIKFGLSAYLASVAGGPQVPFFDVAAFDQGLRLTKKERDHAWDIRWMAFQKAGVSKKDFMELKAKYLAMFMKAKPMMAAKEMFKDQTSLYARLGGIAPITMVVDDFVNMLATDKTQLENPNVVKSLTSGKITGAGLKYLVTEQLAMASGGPFKYTGKTMKESHKDLMINEKQWESAAGILKSVLDKYMVPAKEQGEVFTVISSTHGDIVKGGGR
jgi:hemoglobin